MITHILAHCGAQKAVPEWMSEWVNEWMNEGPNLILPKDRVPCSGWSNLGTVASGKVLLHPLYRWGNWGLKRSPALAGHATNERQQRKWPSSARPKFLIPVKRGGLSLGWPLPGRLEPSQITRCCSHLLVPGGWGTVHLDSQDSATFLPTTPQLAPCRKPSQHTPLGFWGDIMRGL